MDYNTHKLPFKIRKTLRYIRLYGIGRTLVKVKGQYHMKKRFESLPQCATPLPTGGHVGLIGCGNFAFSNIAYYLKKNYGRVMRGSMDIDPHRAASLCDAYNLSYHTTDASNLLDDPEIDIFFIASNHASHAEYAIGALQANKSVHIEKPHVVSENDLRQLCAAMDNSKGYVNIGFNRPYSRIGQAIKTYLETQSGPIIFNWFVRGHEIPSDHWYFKKEEGGRVLGNLCHWTDFVLQLVAPEHRYPLTITPARGTQSDCDIAITYAFGDGSIAAITYSAKGHTFEGVRERFSAHRGDVMISMDDFKSLTVEIIERKIRLSPFFRDHGHELNIMRSYEMVRPKSQNATKGCTIDYVWETGNLFLKTREALETNSKFVIKNGFHNSK